MGAAMPVVATGPGESSSKLLTADDAADYPCVRRLRHRRLLAFLSLQGHEAALAPMAADTDACLSVSYLRRLVERGQWKDAVGYLLRFLPPDGPPSLGLEAQVLRRFLVAHMVLASIIAGTEEGAAMGAKYSTKYLNHGRSVPNGTIRLRSIMLTALCAKEQLRASLDWECVRRQAAEIVDDLAYRTPELKHVVLKPDGAMKPHNVLPIGSSYRRRYPHKKQPRSPQACLLAKVYIRKRSSLVSSSGSQEPRDALLTKAMAMDMVADAVDKCLKAGLRPKESQQHPLQPSGREGPPKNPGIPSVSNAGAPIAPVSQSMNLASNANFSGAPVPQSMNLRSHAGISGATVARVPQTMIGPLPGTVNITGMPSMANAGTSSVTNADNLMMHRLNSGAPFTRMMFGSPILQTMSGWPAKGPPSARAEDRTQVAGLGAGSWNHNHSGLPASLNAGATVAPVTQSMFGTMAGPRDLRMPSVENAGLASHVQSAGVPVSKTVFGCLTNPAKNSGISLMTDADTNKHLTPEGFNAESAHQSSARKNTRDELNSHEKDLHPKWQWNTGAFDEADLVEHLLEGGSEMEAEARPI